MKKDIDLEFLTRSLDDPMNFPVYINYQREPFHTLLLHKFLALDSFRLSNPVWSNLQKLTILDLPADDIPQAMFKTKSKEELCFTVKMDGTQNLTSLSQRDPSPDGLTDCLFIGSL